MHQEQGDESQMQLSKHRNDNDDDNGDDNDDKDDQNHDNDDNHDSDENDDEQEMTVELKNSNTEVNLPANGSMLIIKTVSLYANFFLLLSACAQLNGALIDLACKYTVTLAAFSIQVSIFSISYFIGSCIGGLLYDKYNVFAILSAFSLLFILAMSVAAFTPTLLLFFTATFVWAISAGAIDSSINSYILWLWQDHKWREPVMQGLHASWSGGSTWMGAVLRLFLDPQLQTLVQNELAGNATLQQQFACVEANYSSSSSSSSARNQEAYVYNGSVQLALPLLAGVAVLPFSSHCLLFAHDQLLLLRRSRSDQVKEAAATSCNSDNSDKIQQQRQLLTGRRKVYIVAMALLVRLFDVEIIASTFITSYLFYSLHWSTPDAAVAFSCFFAGHCCGRLASVAISSFLRPLHIMLGSAVLIIASAILLSQLGHQLPAAAYVAAFAIGAGNSSTFPCLFLWLSQFTQITGRVSASLFIGDLLTLLSPLLGHAIESGAASIYPIYLICSAMMSASWLLIANFCGKRLLSSAAADDAAAAGAAGKSSSRSSSSCHKKKLLRNTNCSGDIQL